MYYVVGVCHTRVRGALIIRRASGSIYPSAALRSSFVLVVTKLTF
jgi:hypothetical protein